MIDWTRAKVLLRWIVLLPAALLAAVLAGFLVSLADWLFDVLTRDEFDSDVLVTGMTYAAMGCAFVGTGVTVAPSHRRVIAYVIAGLGFLLGGLFILSSFWFLWYKGIWAWFSFLIGIGSTLYGGRRGGGWDFDGI